ncbi:FAD dependent oxidoreductase [compost metagenome]
MPVCLAMGEAAGIAAAMASVQPAPDVHAVNIAALRRRLREEGAYLPDTEAETAAATAGKTRNEEDGGGTSS